MSTQMLDSDIYDVKPGEHPLYTNKTAEVANLLPQGQGSGTDADTVDRLRAVTATKAGPNKLVATSDDGLLPTSIIPQATTTQTDVTGSRAWTTVYQNTTGKLMYVNVGFDFTAGGDVVTIKTDSAATPTVVVARCGSSSALGSYHTVFFIVLPQNYYAVSHTGGGTLSFWIETT